MTTVTESSTSSPASDDLSWSAILRDLFAGRSLSLDVAADVMGSMLRGEAADAQVGALAAALRMKGETAEEVTGFARAMIDAATPLPVAGSLLDTCGTGGDGAGTFNVSTLAAIVAAAAGARVAKHGNRASSGRCGSADVLEELGVRIDLPAQHVATTIDRLGIGFCFAPTFHPAMRHVAIPRRQLGVPTVFNVLGPLTNPARADHQAIGVADARMAPVIAEVIMRLGTTHSLVFRGGDGLDELTTTCSSIVLDVRPDGIREVVVEPEALGLRRAETFQLRGGDAAQNAEIARRVLKGHEGPARDIVLLNAAAGLWAADLVSDLSAGLERAATAVDHGVAATLVEEWVELSQSLGGTA